MSQKRLVVKDVLEMVASGDVSDISDLSDDDTDLLGWVRNSFISWRWHWRTIRSGEVSNHENTEDDTPLSLLAKQHGEDKTHTFRWRKADLPVIEETQNNEFTDVPEEVLSAFLYFKQFFTDDLLKLIVENTNLYSI